LTWSQRLDTARRKLNEDCRGLLEAPESAVVFTHRSIPEFLHRKDIQAQINHHMKSFCPEIVLSQLLLTALRYSMTVDPSEFLYRYRNVFLYAILNIRLCVKADDEPYDFLEYLSSVKLEDNKFQTGHVIHYKFGHGLIIGHSVPKCLEISPYISAFLGDYKYVTWKMRHSSDGYVGFKIGRLLPWATNGGFHGHMGYFEILKVFLNQLRTPNIDVFDESTCNAFQNTMFESTTFWQAFIGWTVIYMPLNLSPRTRNLFGEVVELFLEYDADPYIRLLVLSDDVDQNSRLVLLVGGEWREFRVHGILYGGRGMCDIFFLRDEKEFSLRDLIKFWDLENRDTLLQLLDRNIKRREQAVQREVQTMEFTHILSNWTTWLLCSISISMSSA
jgi:hypothetical protein